MSGLMIFQHLPLASLQVWLWFTLDMERGFFGIILLGHPLFTSFRIFSSILGLPPLLHKDPTISFLTFVFLWRHNILKNLIAPSGSFPFLTLGFLKLVIWISSSSTLLGSICILSSPPNSLFWCLNVLYEPSMSSEYPYSCLYMLFLFSNHRSTHRNFMNKLIHLYKIVPF